MIYYTETIYMPAFLLNVSIALQLRGARRSLQKFISAHFFKSKVKPRLSWMQLLSLGYRNLCFSLCVSVMHSTWIFHYLYLMYYVLYILCTSHIHYIYIAYTLHIHYIYITYTLHIHCIYIAYTLHIRYIYIT